MAELTYETSLLPVSDIVKQRATKIIILDYPNNGIAKRKAWLALYTSLDSIIFGHTKNV